MWTATDALELIEDSDSDSAIESSSEEENEFSAENGSEDS
jgi:hypothetical protein